MGLIGGRNLVISSNARTSQYGEILAVAGNESSVGIKDIIGSMRPLGPIASSMGINYDEAAAA